MVHSLHHESSQYSRHRPSSSIRRAAHTTWYPTAKQNAQVRRRKISSHARNLSVHNNHIEQHRYSPTQLLMMGRQIRTSLLTITSQFVPRWPAPHDVGRNDERAKAKATYTSDFSHSHLSAYTPRSVPARIMTCQCLRSSAISIVISFLAIKYRLSPGRAISAASSSLSIYRHLQ